MILAYFFLAISAALAVCSLVGFVQVLNTRPDAFEAADRRPKSTWATILGVITVIMFMQVWGGSPGFGFLAWISCVFLGVYFFDVRPQIKDILSGNYWY
ncbi:MAG: DUF2516 family protein [Corynebacterium sp.]|nr:DUF2516 family protein [Corynebacterium sp.]